MKIHSIHLLIIALLIGSLSSCKVLQGFRYMKKESISTQKRIIGNQEIIFVPIAHFGQKIFYKSLKDSITLWKNSAYRIYYEQIETEASLMGLDTIAANTLRKKWRRINGGFGMTREDYDVLKKIFKEGVTQPEWTDLGITHTDLNADYTLLDIIKKYESLYGTVALSTCDLTTTLDDDYSCHESLDNDIWPILFEFRNDNVVELIKAKGDKKIALIYGARHIKPIIKLLKAKKSK